MRLDLIKTLLALSPLLAVTFQFSTTLFIVGSFTLSLVIGAFLFKGLCSFVEPSHQNSLLSILFLFVVTSVGLVAESFFPFIAEKVFPFNWLIFLTLLWLFYDQEKELLSFKEVFKIASFVSLFLLGITVVRVVVVEALSLSVMLLPAGAFILAGAFLWSYGVRR